MADLKFQIDLKFPVCNSEGRASLQESAYAALSRMIVGLNVKSLILPETTAVNSGFGAVAFLDRAPHPNAAKVFINWVLSQEGQALISATVRVNSRRLDVPVIEPPTRVSEEQFKTRFHVSRQKNEEFADSALKMAKTILK